MARDLKFLFRPKLTSARTIVRAEATATGNKVGERQRINDTLRDVEYLQRRAEQEVAQAQQATDPAVVAIHFQLAEEYLERVRRLGPSEK